MNADCIINNSALEKSQKLFSDIIKFLADHDLLAPILIGGMRLKVINAIPVDAIGERIPYQRLHFSRGPETRSEYLLGLNDVFPGRRP